MAFHVACPITCRRICYCSLGFPAKLRSEKGKDEFLEEVERIRGFLSDPLLFKVKDADATVQVSVPKVVVVVTPPPPPPPPPVVADGDAAAAAKDELFFSSSSAVQSKRAFIQKKAAAASLVAEDFARRFESGVLLGATKDPAIQEHAVSNAKVMCRLCFSGENEGSDRERKMLSCKSCGKKYHRSCLKAWAQHRDLFHWSSWTCPSCRICEACRKTDDPHKLMFCKRCDGAYHCYCQQPMHKNVSSGPYLCPKHTRCHSCGSTVPGNGLSVRWFLGYTCCDACGRLFVKGNYCPVCLKVYRDSESTPMVCCDVCERWVHCQCDGISDEKYMQFQVDGNLQYRCATCRGECYQVRDVEDAVQELWRRRDKADQELTASLRAAAGLPTQEEIFSISPYSDDEDYGPTASKNQYSRSLKFSLKGPVDKSPKKGKEFGKKSSNKKYGKKKGFQTTLIRKTEPHSLFDGNSDAQSIGYITADNKDEDAQSGRIRDVDLLSFPGAGSLTDGACSINQTGLLKHRFIDEISAQTDYKISRGNGNRQHGLDTGEDVEKHYSKSKTTKGPKLVIHLGNRNKNVNSPRSDAPNYQREQELTTSNGSEDMSQQRGNDKHVDIRDTSSNLHDAKGENTGRTDQMKGSKLKGRDGNTIKIRKLNPEVSDVETHVLSAKRSGEGSAVAATETPASRDNSHDVNEDTRGPSSTSHILQKDLKPLLKLKFKNPYSENQSLWAPPGEEDKNFVKGQRSKRKRPSMEKTSAKEEDKQASPLYEDSMMGEIMDANWIIQKLGKDAIGKKVEVHRPSNNSWHKGVVTEVFERTSIISVALDDGNTKIVDLSKLGVRFVSQRHRR